MACSGHLKSGFQEVVQNQQIAQSVITLSNDHRRINAENVNLAHNVEQFRHETRAQCQLAGRISDLRSSHETVAQNLQSIPDSQRDIQSSLSASAARHKPAK